MPWIIIVLGYFLGSIPTAYIAGHVFRGVDIRQVEDKNMGAANAFRQLGAKAGVAVGIVDAGKGALQCTGKIRLNLSFRVPEVSSFKSIR